MAVREGIDLVPVETQKRKYEAMASHLIDEFIQALDEEIKASQKDKTTKVFQGRFLREISGLFVYSFNLENFLVTLEDTPAKILIRGNEYGGYILSTHELEVEIGLEHFCGQFIPEAELKTDPSYLLDKLKKKFEECRSGATKVDFHLSEILFSGQQSYPKSNSQAEIHYSLSIEPPNESQKRAVQASFSSELAIIWGPPGTGKTKTAAMAIEAHLNAGRRVLLVSHSNNAVDEALEDVAEHLKTTSFYQEGKLVRLGKPQEEHRKKLLEKYPLVLLDEIAARLGESLSREKNELEAEKSLLEDKLASFEGVFRALQKRDATLSALDDLKLSLSESERRLRLSKADLDMLEESQRKKREKLLEAESSGRLKRILKGLDPQKLQHEIDQTTISVDSKMRLVRELDRQLRELRVHIHAKENESQTDKTNADELLKQLGVSANELENRKNELDQRRNNILARIAEINRQLDEIQKKILSEAQLVATTLTKTFVSKQFPDAPFDVLVLDEASMAPLTHLYWAAGRCHDSVTIIGDFLQLPPICLARDKPMAQKWLGRSIFNILGIDSVEKACNDSRVKLLDIQYRMAPEISVIPNRFFYQDKLKNDPRVLDRSRLYDGISELPLVLVETTTMNPWCCQLSRGSRFNLYNALVCASLAKRIIKNIPDVRIGILTPYGAQATLIHKIAKDWGLLGRLRISTVHKFQGGEEKIIIFDTTEGLGPKVAPMLDEIKNHDSDARLVLNVAFTRAEYRIYLVAHTKKLLAELHPDCVLFQVVRHFQGKAEKHDSETFVDKYFATDFEKWAKDLLVSRAPTASPDPGSPYNERNFWYKFFEDLTNTKEQLIINSPFLTGNRANTFMDYFRSMIERGIKINVHTWPSNRHQGNMARESEVVIATLRSIGVKVIPRYHSKKHFKTAIMDNRILWDGSLNILSHKNTEEHMWRFEGSSAIDQIVKDLQLDEDMPDSYQSEERCPRTDCDGFLVVRSKFGRKFLGCSNYPKCKYTRPLSQDRRPQHPARNGKK